jgi:hypothetical protein
VTAFFGLLLYYVLSSVLFCVGMDENDTCPEQNIDGWLNAVYFASVTMVCKCFAMYNILLSEARIHNTIANVLSVLNNYTPSIYVSLCFSFVTVYGWIW